MNIASKLELSYYKDIATINKDHKVNIVQNITNNKIYVKKIINTNFKTLKFMD